LTVPSNAAFSFGTNNFTLECWVYTTNPANTNGKTIVDSRPDSTNGVYWIWDLTNSGQLRFFNPIGGTSVTSTNPIPFNQWVHIAVTRASGTVTLWVNGTSVASLGSTAESWVSGSLKIGANAFRSIVPDTYWNGYISNLRIVNGTAVYTGTPFTPPTLAPLTTAGSTSAASYPSTTNVNTSFASSSTSLLLNFTNAGIYDAAVQSNATTFGNAQTSIAVTPKWPPTSIRFNGSPDYLSTPIPSLIGAFTIEFWVYTPSAGNNYFFTIGDALNSTGLEVYLGTAGTALNLYSAGATRITSATLPSVGVWNYIAVTRDSSNVIRLYLAGSQVGSTYTSSAAFATTLRLGVEFYNSGLSYGNCYIQDFRITNGVARTIAPPPPTAAFPTR
jgi:hypothetical protein